MPEQDKQDIRIGVFICHCGSNIAGYLDMEELERYAKTLPYVVFVQRNLYTCSEGGIHEIQDGIRAQDLNRVVVASCTPRTHEPLFKRSCKEAGLNPFLFEMVNIRDQCSWVHARDRGEAVLKAKDLIRMGVAKAVFLEPQEPIVSRVHPGALVVGGGIAGMTASLALADRGYEVVLVEKEVRLGGMLNSIYKLGPAMTVAGEAARDRIDAVMHHPKITVYTKAAVTDVRGFIGNYHIEVEHESGVKEMEAGVILLATGGRVLRPEGLFGYDGRRVITQLEMEKRLERGPDPGIRSVVMIQCVGSRNEERPYCSRICCRIAVKNALLIKEGNPDVKVSILYRDMQMYGVENEEMYRDSRARGVRYLNYDPSRPPEVEAGQVRLFHPLLGREMILPADLVVLSTPLIPTEDAEALSQILRVPLDENGFFLEGHAKLKPLDFSTDGIFLCGSARFPANVREAVAQGLGAGARASIPLSRGSLEVEPIISFLSDEDACWGCGICVTLCPYGALELRDTGRGKKVRMIEVACKGCGTCAAACPRKAIDMIHFRDREILAAVHAGGDNAMAEKRYAGSAPAFISVSGYRVADSYYYHSGHAWIHPEKGMRMKVGVDDFLVRILGPADAFRLPGRGMTLRRGMPGWSLTRNHHRADILAPVTGKVFDINHRALAHPELTYEDPYGEGWLFILEAATAKDGLKHLYFGEQGIEWMENESKKLLQLLGPDYERLAATGGEPIADLFGHFPEIGWDNLVQTFLQERPE